MPYRRQLGHTSDEIIESEVQEVIQDHSCRGSAFYGQSTRCGIGAGTAVARKSNYNDCVTVVVELFKSQSFTTELPIVDESQTIDMTSPNTIRQQFAFRKTDDIATVTDAISTFTDDICQYFSDELPEFGDHHIVDVDGHLRCATCRDVYTKRHCDSRVSKLDAYGYFLERDCTQ